MFLSEASPRMAAVRQEISCLTARFRLYSLVDVVINCCRWKAEVSSGPSSSSLISDSASRSCRKKKQKNSKHTQHIWVKNTQLNWPHSAAGSLQPYSKAPRESIFSPCNVTKAGMQNVGWLYWLTQMSANKSIWWRTKYFTAGPLKKKKKNAGDIYALPCRYLQPRVKRELQPQTVTAWALLTIISQRK